MNDLDYKLSFTLIAQKKCFGSGPMRLLKGIEKTGSLQKSADEMGMSYSKAWKILHEIEEIWGFSMVKSHSGGSSGGGSQLTEEGKNLLTKYEAMLSEIEKSASESFKKYFG